MSEALFEFLGITVTVTGAYAALSIAVMILFMSVWLVGRKKRTGKEIFAGQVMNGIGFGLLPALSVLKAFQDIRTGTGAHVFEPLPLCRWITENGYFMPCRIELAAAAGSFILMCLWLIIRKSEMPDNGDLLMTAVCIWAAIRLVTEDFRSEPQDLFRYASCITLSGCMILWSARRTRMIHAAARMAADLLAIGICIAVNLITAKGILSVGSSIGDFAVKTGTAVLALLLTLMAGGEIRRIIPKDDSSQ